MSDTPETDAAVEASGGDWSPVLRAVAQRLERERDRARSEWYSLQDAFENSCDKIEKLESERDEARELAERLFRERAEALKEIHNQFVEYDKLFDEAEQIRIERDEAREAVSELWQAVYSYIPHFDLKTINRWRKAAGWDEYQSREDMEKSRIKHQIIREEGAK